MEQSERTALTEHNKAVSRAILRGAVAGYLIYLGGSMVYEQIQGTTTLQPILGWTVGPLFVVAGAGFGWLTWRRWKADEKEVQALSQEAKASEDSDPNE